MSSDASSEISIRAAVAADADPIASIYNHYVANTVITFEEQCVSHAEMQRRITEVQSAALPWLVAEEGARVVGYAYATQWKARSAYRFSAEVTIYLERDHSRRRIGSQLYRDLFRLLQHRGIHTVMGCIALPNDASVALHEKFGMRKVAHFDEVGFKQNRWVDVGYWQRTLENLPTETPITDGKFR